MHDTLENKKSNIFKQMHATILQRALYERNHDRFQPEQLVANFTSERQTQIEKVLEVWVDLYFKGSRPRDIIEESRRFMIVTTDCKREENGDTVMYTIYFCAPVEYDGNENDIVMTVEDRVSGCSLKSIIHEGLLENEFVYKSWRGYIGENFAKKPESPNNLIKGVE